MKIQEVKTLFQGRVITPTDDEYDKARTTFYGGIDRKPSIIIRVTGSDDIKNAIRLAKDTGLELAIRSGGHSIPGYCVSDGGIVIDLHDMRRMEFDLENKTVWADAGLKARDVTEAADKHDLVIGFGDTGSVGIGGITLGGGIGFLTRKFGLTIDSLLAAEIITADGELLQIDSQNNEDLFWGIRGGGGNFGVITRFKYQLHELSEAYGGMLILPATPEVIYNYISLSEKAPHELSSIINIMPAPPMAFLPAEIHGKLVAMALIMYAGDPKEGEKVLSPFRELAVPYVDMLKPMRYKDIFLPDNDTYHPTVVLQTMFINNISLPASNTIIKYLEALDAPMRNVQLRVLGGAVNQVHPDSTAFAHRAAPIMANIASFYSTEEEKRVRQGWVDKLAKEMFQGYDGVYVGFLDNNPERLLHAYPANTYRRLVEVKKRYDPANLFKLNFNINTNP